MALEGSIRDFALPDIIQFIQQQNKSGVLTIEDQGRWAKILFEEGKIVFAYTADTESPKGLAQELIDGEWVPEVKVRSLLIGNPDWVAFEAGLSGPGGLSPEVLSQFFILHTTEILYRLFQLKEGKYRFEPTGGIPKPRNATPMDSDYILLEGMRQFDEWPMLRRQIASNNIIFDKEPEKISSVKVVVQEAETGGENLEESSGGTGISAAEMEVYEKVDGHRDVEKLVALSKKGEFDTIKILGSLFARGLILKIGERQPEGPDEEPKIVKLDEPVRAPARNLQKTGNYPYLWNGVVVLILVAWTVIYAPGLKKSLMGTVDYRQILRSDVITVDKRKAQEAVLVYFLRNQVFPESTDQITRQIESSRPIFDSLKRLGVPYEMTAQEIP